jgi:hypothetical protein
MDDRIFTIVVGGSFGLASVLISSGVSYLIARRTTRGNTEKNLIEHYVRRISSFEKAKERLTSSVEKARQDTSGIFHDVERAMTFVISIFECSESILSDICHAIPPEADARLKNLQSQIRSSRVRRNFIDKGMAKPDEEFGKHFEGEWLDGWSDILPEMENFEKTLRSTLDNERKRPTNPSRAPAAEAGGQGGRLPWKCGTVGGEYWGLPVALAVAAAP